MSKGEQNKVCSKCKLLLPLGAFYAGGQSYCKTCSSTYRKQYYARNKEVEKVKIREWHTANKDKVREYYIQKMYGVSIDEYEAMRFKQRYLCAICGTHESLSPRKNYRGSHKRALHVDHCHVTSKVRGLLCFNCNAMLGKAKDNIHILKNAIRYLETYEENSQRIASTRDKAASGLDSSGAGTGNSPKIRKKKNERSK